MGRAIYLVFSVSKSSTSRPLSVSLLQEVHIAEELHQSRVFLKRPRLADTSSLQGRRFCPIADFGQRCSAHVGAHISPISYDLAFFTTES